MTSERRPIDELLDGIEWRPCAPCDPPPGDGDGDGDGLPRATHEGTLTIGGFTLRVYTLDDGRRIIDADDLAAFFGIEPGERVER